MRKTALLVLAWLLGCYLLPAASAADYPESEIALRVNTASVRQNGEVVVTVTANPADRLYGVEFKVLYDASALELVKYAGVSYSVLDNDLTDKGLLYVPALAKEKSRSGRQDLVAITFKALKSGDTAVEAVPVKGVTDERTTRVVDGQTYPDLVAHPLKAGVSKIAIRVTGNESAGSSSPVSGVPSVREIVEAVGKEPDRLKAANDLADGLNRLTGVTEEERPIVEKLVRETSARLLTLEFAPGAQSLTVDAAALEGLLAAADKLRDASGRIGLEVPAPASLNIAIPDGNSGRMTFSSAAIEAMRLRGLHLSVHAEGLAMTVPAETLREAGGDTATLSIKPGPRRHRQTETGSFDPLASYAFELGSGREFAKPVTIRWSYPEEADPDLLGVYLLDEERDLWTYVRETERSRDNRTLTVRLTHFSTYALAAYNRRYEDLGSTYEEAVRAIRGLSARHVLNGISDTEFGPRKEVTRAEWTAMLARAMGWTASEKGAGSFSDVPEGRWYTEAVGIAYERGLIDGYPDGTFRPDVPISRAELAVLLARLNLESSAEEHQTQRFEDDAFIPEWAAEAVYKAKARGWLRGDAANRYNPHEHTVRADAAVVLYRLLESEFKPVSVSD